MATIKVKTRSSGLGPALTHGELAASGDDLYFGNSNNTTVKLSNDGHTHDDRYYTETEVNNLLLGKTSRIVLTGQLQKDSYRRSVIALCDLTNTNPSANSYSVGTLTFHRTNGLQSSVKYDFAIEKRYNREGFNISQTILTDKSFVSGIRPCIFSYEGVKYGGVELFFSVAELSQIDFYGTTNFNIFGLDYYITNTSTVINTEVNDSLIFAGPDIILADTFRVGSKNVILEGDTRLNTFTGSVYGGPDGTAGLVPAPGEAQANAFLRGNAEWTLVTPSLIGALPTDGGTLTNKLIIDNADYQSHLELKRNNLRVQFSPSTGSSAGVAGELRFENMAGINAYHFDKRISTAEGYYIGAVRKDINWDTAYGWGNHASAGYLTSIPTASTNVLGGIKVGNGLSIANGVLSANSQTEENFTTTLKNKLDGIATGATNVVEATVSGWGFTKNTGTVTGTGAANGLAYWTGTNSIDVLGTATYPSLNELSFVKGVTSSIQTQLSGKAPTSHASTETTYGAGSTTNYGHVKLGATGGAATYEHTHGTIANNGSITTTATPVTTDFLLISDSSDSGKIKKAIELTGSTSTFLNGNGTFSTPPNTTYTFATGTTNGTFNVTPSGGSAQSVSIYGLASGAYAAAYSHPTSDGNKHVPANGTSNDGKFLKATSVPGDYVWDTIVQNATHTGDVTGSVALTIANDAVTNAKLANMATARIKGRVTAGTGDPEDLTVAQVQGLIGLETSLTTNSDVKIPSSKAVADYISGFGYTSNQGTITGVTAGNGLSGGGTSGAITLTMGTPSTLTDATTNNVTSTSHTHAITNYAINGTTNQITVTGAGKVLGATTTLSLPQNIHTEATPQFARLGLGVTASSTIPLYIKSVTPEIKLEAGTSTDSAIIRYDNISKSIKFIFA